MKSSGEQNKMSEDFLPELRELIACSIPIRNCTKNGEVSRNVMLEEWTYEKDLLTGELKRGEQISCIEIKDLPQNIFVFKVDAFPQPQALFNDVKEVRKRSDFILIANGNNGQKRIIFIEMKRTKDSDHGIVSQLRGAICIMDYCNSILKNFWAESAMIKGYEYRFVSISSASGKHTTHRADDPLHNIPENRLRLKGNSFTYRQLIKY